MSGEQGFDFGGFELSEVELDPKETIEEILASNEFTGLVVKKGLGTLYNIVLESSNQTIVEINLPDGLKESKTTMLEIALVSQLEMAISQRVMRKMSFR